MLDLQAFLTCGVGMNGLANQSVSNGVIGNRELAIQQCQWGNRQCRFLQSEDSLIGKCKIL